MKRSFANVILSLLLVVSLGAHAYLYVDRAAERASFRDIYEIMAGYMDAYDQLVCDLICGKSLDVANEILAPNRVARFKQRRDFGQLHIGNTIVDLCLDEDIITGVESSSNPDEWQPCEMAAYSPSKSEGKSDSADGAGSPHSR